jgi:hypothetical protein
MSRLSTVWTLILALLGATSVMPPAVAALSYSQQELLIQEGHESFDRGLSLLQLEPAQATKAFQQAAARWKTLIDDGIENGPLLYNLGNAQVQAGDLGMGIASYLRAKQFMPGNARLQENLAHARTLVSPQFTPDSTQDLAKRLTFWHHNWTLSSRLIIFTIAWTAAWIILLCRRFVSIPGWRWWTGVTLVIGVFFGGSAALSITSDASQRGVLIQDDIIVRKGDGEAYERSFKEPINRGVEFRILEQRPIWLHVEFPNGDDGWVPRGATEVVSRESELLASA